MNRYFSSSKHCLLCGDVNTRCGNLKDYTLIAVFFNRLLQFTSLARWRERTISKCCTI